MSVIQSARVWRMQLPPVPKFVLISLADQANDQGVCWPSVQTLSDRTCYSDRAVQKALRWLTDQGLLDVEIGACRANRYTLRLERYKPTQLPADADCRGEPDSPLNVAHPRTTFTPPPNHVHPNLKRTVSNTPPIPPDGGQLQSCDAGGGIQASGSSSRQGAGITLKSWIEGLRELGEKPIPPNHPIFDYAELVGLSELMITLHWRVFKARHLESGKCQRDWRRKLSDSIKGNWYRLWYAGNGGKMALTTAGIQAQREWGDA